MHIPENDVKELVLDEETHDRSSIDTYVQKRQLLIADSTEDPLATS